MGEHGGLGQPSGMLPHGLLPDEVASVTRVLDKERWMKAEERTSELISCIQPNVPSEERRNAVADYVKQLITNCLACKVFTFGSVPLKTYLPDGDIDLTAFSNNESLKDTWANTVRDALEKEEKSENAEFNVKEVQYIQAEVKLVKCLVENIVVDISFKQLGGLCTLCFLEEIDKLINQNHLFKRSIILIKAWCYYESRILGAHHGLISTYALETLVLYIFHVFNNKFSGPLEVLYRFLEFFSNFDWDKFCISLWGPIPICSLPDMTAEPPRKDNGHVLLSKAFLDSLSEKYAAPPGGLENHGQPFVSKHFNVVDPLRTNNNLGRSVSKGNFYRIRSAFAFGAKRLTMLLECPKEDIIQEVNKFFMNTWERHGSGERPDVPTMDARQLGALEALEIEDLNNRIYTNARTVNLPLKADYEQLKGTGPDLQDTISELLNDICRGPQNMHVTYKSAISRTHSHKCQNFQSVSRVPEQHDGNTSSSGSIQNEKNQNVVIPIPPLNDQLQSRSQIARTRSSPDLSETTFGLSRGRRNRALESIKNQNPNSNSDFGCRGILGSEVNGNDNTKSSNDDPLTARHISSYRGPEASDDSNNISNNYHGDMGFVKVAEELASVSETLDMQQEEQDLVNMMGSCSLNHLNGPVPMHLASPHLPLALSHLPAPMGYPQRFLPSNLSVIGSSWGSSMFHQNLVSSPLSQYVNVANLNSAPEDMSEPLNEGSGTIEGTSIENCDSWHEQIARGSSCNDTDTQKLHIDAKQLKSHTPLQGTNAGVAFSRKHKLSKEDRGLTEDDYSDSSQNQANKGVANDSSPRGANMKFLPVSQANSRSKSTSENSRDGSASKSSKITRDKWGKRQTSVPVVSSLQGKGNNIVQFESLSGPVPSEVEEGLTWFALSNAGMDLPERVSGSPSLSSPHSRSQQLPGFEPAAQVVESDPLVPVGPMLVGTSRQRRVENANVLPVTFVPTGPPVPFLYYPMYNFTSATGNAEGSTNQLGREELDQSGPNSCDQNDHLTENVNRTETFMSSVTSSCSAPESSDGHEHKPDILNSDFASHLENLAYGRSCQNLGYPGPLIYSAPVYGPSMYLQGHYPWDGPSIPISSNMNITQIMGYGSRAVPGIPHQPDRSSNMFPSYGYEAPRYRVGTGTYLPNPKVSFRERQTSSRNHRGYGYDRNEHGDREGSWITLKQQRGAGRNHSRNQAERGNMRNDRFAAGEKQAVGLRESYQHEPVSSYIIHNNSMGSTNRSHNSANVAGVFAEAPPSSNGMNPSLPVAPPLMMVHSYNQGMGYAPRSAEPPEFGSLGPLHLLSANELPRTYEQGRRTRRGGGSPLSSPDQPSSPQLKR